MNKAFKISKYILLLGLPGLVIICFFIRNDPDYGPAALWLLVTALSGFVGISTNTIAIRMLFRPKAPILFETLQGLLPKNRKKIAASIAEQTEQRLLNIDTIMEHIEKGHLIEQTIGSMTSAVDDYLAQKENRKKIAGLILDLYSEYADRFFMWLTQTAEHLVSDFISRRVTVETVWGMVKPGLQKFFDSDELKHKASSWIVSHLIESIPEAADIISSILDTYIENQVWWKKAALRALKQASGLDRETLARLISDMLHSPQTYEQIVRLVEDNLRSIESYLDQEETREKIESAHRWLKQNLLHSTRHQAIPAIRERIDRFLDSDSSWDVIDRYLTAVLNTVPPRMHAWLNSPANIEVIRQRIPEIIRRFNIRKLVADNIENQDMDEFERMILSVTGEHLAAIEVLGGILGMLAGVALKSVAF